MEYKCSNVSKVYHRFGSRKEFPGIEDVTLSFSTGEIIGIVGLSSSGKSTLVDILSMKIKPNKGELNYDALDISRVYKEDGVKLNKNLSVYDNMVLFGKKEKMSELDVENRMAQIRDVFSLNKYINTKVSELSALNKVKCELAMLLLKTPRILFIDDAFSFLNNVDKNEMLKCLKRLNKEERTVIIMTSSRVKDVEKIINRIILVHKNKIVYDDAYNKFKDKYCNKRIFEVYLNKNVSIKELDDVEVIETKEYYYKLAFVNKENMFSNVINLFDVNTIVDLSIGYPPLSEVIENIEKEDKR